MLHFRLRIAGSKRGAMLARIVDFGDDDVDDALPFPFVGTGFEATLLLLPTAGTEGSDCCGGLGVGDASES